MTNGQFTREEIFTQSLAWQGAIDVIASMKNELKDIDLGNYRQIIFTGCGSTYYLSLAVASIFQKQTGAICKAVPGGELLLNPGATYSGNNQLLFAISRSGSTSETVQAAEQFKKDQGGRVISICNYDDRPLTEVADLAICIPEGQEQSIAQTRAFSSMYLSLVAMAMLVSRREDLFDEMKALPDIGKSLIEKYNEFSRRVGENLDYDRFYFLGSGSRYGLACEANLKMKEMTITHTEPFYFLEFRHGPISMVNENTAVVGLLSESQRDYEEKVLDDARNFGARTVSIGETDADVSFESELSEDIRNVLYLPVLQIMAYYRSMKKGLNPDQPNNLTAVVYLE
jgi:glucosamine--fructose-6-phosphate aminotransferase (isomerizing)